jgi:hypothetical protein
MKITKHTLRQIIKEEIEKLFENKKIKTEDIAAGIKIINEYILLIDKCSQYKKDDSSSLQITIDSFKKALGKGSELHKGLFQEKEMKPNRIYYVPANSFNPYQAGVFEKLFDLEKYCIDYIKGGWGFKGFFDYHPHLFKDKGLRDQESFLQILNECRGVLENFADQFSTEIDLGV